jgi:hypothetical protein
MTAAILLRGAAPVFVVRDVARSVERDNVLIHLQAANESRRQPGQGAMRDFNVHDLDGNELCFGMESRRS